MLLWVLKWLYCYLEQVDGKSTVLSFPCAYLTCIFFFWDGTHAVHYQCWILTKHRKPLLLQKILCSIEWQIVLGHMYLTLRMNTLEKHLKYQSPDMELCPISGMLET